MSAIETRFGGVRHGCLVGCLFVLMSIAASGSARAEAALPPELKGVTVAEKLGQRVPLNLNFHDQNGRSVQLSDYFKDGKPVILTLNYYRCPTLCSLQLNAFVTGLKAMKWRVGENFRIVTVSIDPRENSDLAAKKREAYLGALKEPKDADWHFLVGAQSEIQRLASAVGFAYRYDEKQDQYAHPAVLFFVGEGGTVTRYLYGIEYPARDIQFALLETAKGRLGSPIDKLILSCFHYDATIGRYGPFAFGVMRLGGAFTAMILGTFLFVLWRRDRGRRHSSRMVEQSC